MRQFSKYVGLDAHKDTIAVSVAGESGGRPGCFGEIANTPTALKKLRRRLSAEGEVVSYCYEAGPFRFCAAIDGVLGWVPSESSSGPRKRRGGITRTGNGHVRRVLIESAWCYRFPARRTDVRQRRAEKTSAAVQKARQSIAETSARQWLDRYY